MSEINPAIFKAYDIRGVYPNEINEEVAEKVGRAFVELVHPRKCVVGHDMRVSSPKLFESVVQGISDSGTDVIDIGQVSVDQFYFSCANLDTPGIMITASHNPKEYNGFKMVRKIPYAIGRGSGMEDIERIAESKEFTPSFIKGTRTKRDLAKDFSYRMLALLNTDIIKPYKVVIDAGNGMGGVAAKMVYAQLPVKVIPLNWQPDGTFPSHGPDPLQEENRRELVSTVIKEQAHCGFAFDGDCDRFFVVDEHGDIVPGDFVTALLAREFLRDNPGASIVYDLRSSWAVRDAVTVNGGKPLINRVGHAYIKKRMLEEGAIFGGEVSGHYYFKDFFYCDSGILPSLKVLEMCSRHNKTLSELLRPFRNRYFISGEINSRVEDAQSILDNLKQKYQDATITELDGVSVDFKDWHFNVRTSNTEPLIRLNLESMVGREHMEVKRDEVLSLIRS